ncbi:hypothetical protein [Tateyamaria pelophila]|uniref:hypothetical protein n=1 Tax=Tateyamaria pelophila TaxID=328415 RepID=UPI001CBFF5EC|nr:hypothetical protein [Tateyamaria pelophila]
MSHLSLASDIETLNAEICDREFQFMFPEKGSGDPYFARFVCARCGFEGEEAFGPLTSLEDVNAQAKALFVAGVECAAGA